MSVIKWKTAGGNPQLLLTQPRIFKCSIKFVQQCFCLSTVFLFSHLNSWIFFNLGDIQMVGVFLLNRVRLFCKPPFVIFSFVVTFKVKSITPLIVQVVQVRVWRRRDKGNIFRTAMKLGSLQGRGFLELLFAGKHASLCLFPLFTNSRVLFTEF